MILRTVGVVDFPLGFPAVRSGADATTTDASASVVVLSGTWLLVTALEITLY
jgi:hypothetical protein